MNKKTGILLVNLGTPDSPSLKNVIKYLSEFLSDPRVIDLPFLFRYLLVYLIIIPFRAKESSKIYKKLWTKKGSPLLLHTQELTKKLQAELPSQYEVFYAMRYQNPSLDFVLGQMEKKNYSHIHIIPLYPQYASSSSGSTIEKVFKIISKWNAIGEIKVSGPFFDHPDFIKSVVENAQKFDIDSYDHILFSYHGLPTRHLDAIYPEGICDDHDCEKELTTENYLCYKAECYETTRLINNQLNIPQEKITTAFQSRLDDKWIKPYSDKIVEKLAKEGAKKILVLSPAFTADCLETTIEIGDEYQEIFTEHGGEKLDLVPSLNSNDSWVKALKNMIV